MTKLFEPIEVGGRKLQHRLAMAPLTRFRADDDCVPMDIAKEYYIQRACMPGTLIISEAVQISSRFAGEDNCPGIWSAAQMNAWRGIVEAVHERQCFIWCQLWVQGRAGKPNAHRRRGSRFLGASAIPMSMDSEPPEAMSEEDILGLIEDYRNAAKNAMAVGFDGVEVHGGNGYLPDQFLQDVSNTRTDRWGGSIENRARLQLEIIKAIATEIGSENTALRLSPWSDFGAMGMEDPVPTFTYLVEQLKTMKLGFLDLIEARISGNDDANCGVGQDISFLVRTWGNVSPVMISGGFSPESAGKEVDEKYRDYDVVILFGRFWTSNPDLVFRIKEQVALVKYNRATFYTPKKVEGYIDWDFSPEFKNSGVGLIV